MADRAPFVRPIRVESIPEGGLERMIEANEAECEALAAANDLQAVRRLVARFTLRRLGRGRIRVQGELHAEVTQTCVVSLEPIDAVLEEAVDVRFAAPPGAGPRGRKPPVEATEAVAFAPGDEDPPDPIIDGQIDLGALAAEFLSLALDPYPRKPGVDFEPAPPSA